MTVGAIRRFHPPAAGVLPHLGQTCLPSPTSGLTLHSTPRFDYCRFAVVLPYIPCSVLLIRNIQHVSACSRVASVSIRRRGFIDRVDTRR